MILDILGIRDELEEIMKREVSTALNCFGKYMLAKGVIIGEFINASNNNRKNISIQKMYNQMEAMKEFHSISCRYCEESQKRIKSSTGKLMEGYKVDLKIFKRQLQEIRQKDELNKFEKLVLLNGNSMIDKAEESIRKANDSNYLSLILRSMRNNEICLRDTSFDNLMNSDKLRIVNIKKCSYDMVETDGIYFLRKFKTKINRTDMQKFVTEYCRLESLDSYSVNFILSILSYPYEFIKIALRYRDSKKDWAINKYVEKLEKASYIDAERYV